MTKQDPYAKDISGIADFVLRAHGVRVNWRIVALDKDEWSKVSSETSALDELALEQLEQLPKLLADPTVKKDLMTLLKLRESVQLEKQILAEYGTVPSLADYSRSDAMVVGVTETLDLSKTMPHLLPFRVSLAKQNPHLEFLILINSSRFSRASYDERLTILAHEAVHIVEMVQSSQRSSFESIETKVKRLVRDFKRRRKKVSNQKHPPK